MGTDTSARRQEIDCAHVLPERIKSTSFSGRKLTLKEVASLPSIKWQSLNKAEI